MGIGSDIFNQMAGQQLGAAMSGGNGLGQATQQGMQQQNAMNQQVAGNQAQIAGGLANTQLQQGGSFAKALLYEPLFAQMVGNLGGAGGGTVGGYQSANSPQSAMLPGMGGGGNSAGQALSQSNNYNWGAPLNAFAASAAGGGPNPLAFEGYNPNQGQYRNVTSMLPSGIKNVTVPGSNTNLLASQF